jgi:16S rRNA (guanine527-N7)-methyltransferase
MLSHYQIRELLQPFGIRLNAQQIAQIDTYLELLMRWNKKINLTAIRTPEECVTRHFGESFLIARYEPLEGRLLDIGSGAGFPGLAIKIVFPDLDVTLLEPVAKKRAFLKEVARSCDFRDIEVRSERLEEMAADDQPFAVITARAVGSMEELVAQAVKRLGKTGKLHLWISKDQANHMVKSNLLVRWERNIEIPLSRERVILSGSLGEPCFT